MKSRLIQLCRIGSYFGGALFFLFLGYWIKKHFVILDDKVLIAWQESSYLSISFPIWGVNIVAGGLLFYMLLLIIPDFQVLRQRRVHAVVFSILLSICVLPLHASFNTARFNTVKLLPNGYSMIVNGVGTALCFRGLLGMRLSRIHTICFRLVQWARDMPPRTFIVGLLASAVLICSFISWHLFDSVPGTIDGCLYLFQARLFAHGTLSSPIPPEPQFFEALHVILSDSWYTQFPPGYPTILALGVLFRLAWLVNPLLGALTIVCIYLIAKELYEDSIAKLSALLATASSFFLFMSSEFMAHSSTLFFIAMAFLSFVWMVKNKRPLFSAVSCGTALGVALLCRPYTTAWICILMGIAAIVMRKELSRRHILIGAIPILVAGLAFLAYNFATTGHPLLFGYIVAHGKAHYPGFHQDPWMEQSHTLVQGLKYVNGNLNGLNYYLFEWPMPSLFFVCLYLAFGEKRKWEWILAGWIGVLLIAQIFYFFNEFTLGPRYVYETLPALILLTSRGVALSARLLTSWQKIISYAHAQNALCVMLIGFFLFAFLFNIPATAKSYQAYGKDVTIHKYLSENSIEKALIFVKDAHTLRVHYPFNAPFAKPHIYAKHRKNGKRKLAEKFPNYRYFIADENDVVEVSIDEL